MAKRVLVLSASVGSGHKVAAEAIAQALAAYPDVEVRNEDALRQTTRLYQMTAADAYFALVRENPWYVGWLYDYNDEPFRNERGMQLLWNMLNGQPLADLIEKYNPDIIVCTHFMPAGVAAQLLLEERIQARLAIVTTDYDFQGMWLSRTFNRYFVALEEGAAFLAALGVDPERITVSGIPVDAALSAPFDAATVRARYSLDPAIPTLLVSAGALGGGPAIEIVDQIMAMRTHTQVLVICGRNRTLRQEVTARTATQAERFRVLGFSSEMADLMRVATLFLGKPGGLTTAECMASGLPMVVIEPIPGQEERNSDHLLENGAAIRCRNLPALAYKLDRVLSDPAHLASLRAGTTRLARPAAARVVAEALLNDTAEPFIFAAEQRRRIIAAARGEAPVAAPPPVLTNEISLYNDETGVYLGAISPAQLAFLVDQLEEEGLDDDNYYIDEPTLIYLERAGADEDLLELLGAALREHGPADVRFVRP